jgi:hypothetical protein
MRKLKYGMLLLIVAILACTAFWLLTGPGRKTCPLKLVCLSITNSSSSTGGQLAVFSLSNCTSREVVYMAQEGSRPWYSLMQYIRLDSHSVLGTNYNPAGLSQPTTGYIVGALQPHF